MDPRVEQAILLIAIRFRENLALSRIASEVGLSPFHFQRLFKSDVGQTPAAYLNQIRLEHAAHLLVVLSDAPLLAIAIESGFSSAAVFARAFRQRYGESASDFRRRKRLAESESTNRPALALSVQPKRVLRVERCGLDEDALSAGYMKLARGRPSAADRSAEIAAIGIFVDAPFHLDRARCRHYLALEDDLGAGGTNTFELPGGLYASLRVTGTIDALSKEIVRFKSESIDPSDYAIASTLAYERIVLPEDMRGFDYRQSIREVLIKVRRKHEPAI